VEATEAASIMKRRRESGMVGLLSKEITRLLSLSVLPCTFHLYHVMIHCKAPAEAARISIRFTNQSFIDPRRRPLHHAAQTLPKCAPAC
jgi:hypothetical protein